MSMSEDIHEDEDFENGTSVEVEDDDSSDEYEVSSSDGGEEETRTNVRKKQKQQVRQAPPQQRDPKLESWLGKNSWFGSDRVMTRAAQAIHEELVLEQDFDPTSDDYYKEIDSRMRKEMPQRFNTGKRSNAQTVAPASSGRSVKSGRKKAVELTPGQVAFAKKMRIPLEKYAKEVAKISSRRA